MPPRRQLPRRPTRHIITTEDAENNNEGHLQHRDLKAARVTLEEIPSLPPPLTAESSAVATPTSLVSLDISTPTIIPMFDSELSIKACAGEAAYIRLKKFN